MRHKRAACLHSLIQDQIAVARLLRWQSLRVRGLLAHFFAVHEHVKVRICRPDRLVTVTEDGVVKAFAYNGDGTINTVSWPVGALTRTETYSYTSGVLTGMTAVEA